jgi:hypothetical protein
MMAGCSPGYDFPLWVIQEGAYVAPILPDRPRIYPSDGPSPGVLILQDDSYPGSPHEAM